MALRVVRNIVDEIQTAKYFCLVANEVTDAANREQIVICFQTVNDQLEAEENFVRLQVIELIQSDRIVQKTLC